MEFRHLGKSGLKVSAISYGNWITHGSQLEAEQATACVRAALEAGITTFDTADVYANGRAEIILGEALAGEMTPVCHANTFMRRSTLLYVGSKPNTSIFTKRIATTTRRR
jgi:predicted aldo/keto reductase-like oxidoreductase